MNAQLVILDFGSQYTQLIARTVRELGVYCEIIPGTASSEKVLRSNPKAIILSGGAASVIGDDALRTHPAVMTSGLPLFGICYGMQLLADEFGGKVGGWARDAVSGSHGDAGGDGLREFGPAVVTIEKNVGPFSALAPNTDIHVWMSHGDKVTELPPGFVSVAKSNGSPIAAFANTERNIYGVQFHPEVHHTPRGKEILASFLFDCAKLERDWDSEGFIAQTIEGIKKTVPTGNVICGLSGGVDSTVAAVLVSRAIGDRLHCIFVDNGVLRLNETTFVMENLTKLGLNVTLVDASKRFLDELAGVTDPETKRKIIGRVFIEVFEEEAHRVEGAQYLVQGTLYPDVIESVSVVGKSAVIKSHHNVGGLIENMKLKLIEPLRELFKDEVRRVGTELGIPSELILRQPFPGPGLGIRCLGEVTEERLKKLRIADRIVTEEINRAGLNATLWQSFAVLLPVRSVGVMGDGRTYDETIAIRAVTSRDGMTADWYLLPEDVLRRMSSRIVNETDGVNRVVLDVTSKPPSTIEWE
ncbi:MAG: glutamine-hydrolyzing GMP synthase [Deltaproteobacteria bacterium]|nr:glutamine-hydrolyzing GMP synthase [Deltaproteobacteria bacterium]